MSVIEFLTLFWELFQFAVLVAGAVTVMWVVMELIERMEK